MTKVVQPMNSTAGTMSTCKKAKVTPTARASMLVATARGSMVRKEKELFSDSSPHSLDSRIMFTPMIPSRIKAIQWSRLAIMAWKRTPSSQPNRGIRAWNRPK